jgi:hypothetical protein
MSERHSDLISHAEIANAQRLVEFGDSSPALKPKGQSKVNKLVIFPERISPETPSMPGFGTRFGTGARSHRSIDRSNRSAILT